MTSREQRLITKERIATHTNLLLALYFSILVIKTLYSINKAYLYIYKYHDNDISINYYFQVIKAYTYFVL